MKRLISSCYLNPGLFSSSRLLLHVNIQQCTVFICMYIFICPRLQYIYSGGVALYVCVDLYTAVLLLLHLAIPMPYINI